MNDTIKNKFGLSGFSTSLWNGYVAEFIKSIKYSNVHIHSIKATDGNGSLKLSSPEKTILNYIAKSFGERSTIDGLVLGAKFNGT